jgi:hypothetical protein
MRPQPLHHAATLSQHHIVFRAVFGFSPASPVRPAHGMVGGVGRRGRAVEVLVIAENP